MTEQTRSDAGIQEPAAERPSAKARSRLRQALLCPYCRDAVTRFGTVACARRGCGALYHRACWDECSKGYGGCAIYGCESTKTREVSAVGWFVRIVRLAVAVALFPRRVVQAYKAERKITEADRRVLARIDRRSFAAMAALAMLLALLEWIEFGDLSSENRSIERHPVIASVFMLLVLFFVVMRLRIVRRAFVAVLKAELAALVRVDDPEGTVLARLRRGSGSKQAVEAVAVRPRPR